MLMETDVRRRCTLLLRRMSVLSGPACPDPDCPDPDSAEPGFPPGFSVN